jgi:hypothetical protein
MIVEYLGINEKVDGNLFGVDGNLNGGRRCWMDGEVLRGRLWGGERFLSF